MGVLKRFVVGEGAVGLEGEEDQYPDHHCHTFFSIIGEREISDMFDLHKDNRKENEAQDQWDKVVIEVHDAAKL